MSICARHQEGKQVFVEYSLQGIDMRSLYTLQLDTFSLTSTIRLTTIGHPL